MKKEFTMRKLFLLLLVFSLIFSVSSCKSATTPSQPSSPTPASGSQPQAPTPGTPAPPPEEPKPSVPRQFEASDKTPSFFRDALKKKSPIFLLFYSEDEEDATSLAILEEVEPVKKTYEGQAVFFLLKVTEERDISNLAEEFEVGFIPYIAVLNRKGTIIFEKTGYVDSKVLEQALYNAVNK